VKFPKEANEKLAEIARKQEEARALRAQLQLWTHAMSETGLDSDDCVSFGLDVTHASFLKWCETNQPAIRPQPVGVLA